MNPSSVLATSSSTASSPIATESPGMPNASVKSDSRMSTEPNSFDAASTSQVRSGGCIPWRVIEKQRRKKKKKTVASRRRHFCG